MSPAVRYLRTAILTLLAGIACTEGALRAIGYRYSPLKLLPPRTAGDYRGLHVAGTVYSVFDPQLFWRFDRSSLAWLNEQGFRGPLASAARDPGVKVVFALGDSNTAGPPREVYHWPGDLEDLAALNAREGEEIRVVNAGVYGYSSFQGLRRFKQIAGYRPDVVYFSFGANDAQRVALSDAAYAARLDRFGWLRWLRLAPPLAHALWVRSDRAGGATTHRVPLPEYEGNLTAFVEGARSVGSTPVLLTRPFLGSSSDPDYWVTYEPDYNGVVRRVADERKVPLVDAAQAFAGRSEMFVDDSHLNRAGYRQLAELLLEHLKSLGLVDTTRRFASAVEAGSLDDARLELRSGFWAREEWAGSVAGRWTAAQAVLVLERRSDERGLLVEARFYHPEDRTRLRVEANGVLLGTLEAPNGPVVRRFDISGVAGREIDVRLDTERPFSPADDGRTLGVFLQRAALVPSAFASSLDLGEPGALPELGEGWWDPEPWPGGGRPGRWTQGTAWFRLGRRASETRLVLQTSGRNPHGAAAVRVEIDGRLVRVLRVENATSIHVIELPPGGGADVEVGLTTERTFVPARVFPGISDRRTLGVFVHAVRLAGEHDP
ncbi:MAG TPA: GDSL-type esterase/lipase family protein [Vicinamibacteria bacterium]|nr:GDSL-type esterase/lipase family protein [Vicinamibacteria bacterium]